MSIQFNCVSPRINENWTSARLRQSVLFFSPAISYLIPNAILTSVRVIVQKSKHISLGAVIVSSSNKRLQGQGVFLVTARKSDNAVSFVVSCFLSPVDDDGICGIEHHIWFEIEWTIRKYKEYGMYILRSYVFLNC